MSHSAGTTTGYQPQYKNPETDKWVAIDIKHEALFRGKKVEGMPYPPCFAGILHHTWLCAKNQALALAYEYAAIIEGTSYREIEVRAAPFTITFDIKWEPKE